MTVSDTLLDNSTYGPISGGALQFYSRNLIAEVATGSIYWSTQPDHDNADDITDPDYPVTRLVDGNAALATRPIAQAGATDYFLHFFVAYDAADVTEAESLIMRLTPRGDITSMQATLADDAAFTAGPAFGGVPVDVADWTGTFTDEDAGRFWARYLKNGGSPEARAKFVTGSGGYYGRIQFTGAADFTPPEVQALFFGNRRLYPRPPGLPFDEAPRSTDKTVFEGKGRVRQRYLRHEGAADFGLSLSPSGIDSIHGVDDLAAVRGVWSDSLGTRFPIWFSPGRNLDTVHLMEISEDELRFELQDFLERTGEWQLTELPVFASRDSHVLADDFQTTP